MTLDQFRHQIKWADWNYQYADGPAYSKGKWEIEELTRAIDEHRNDPEWVAIWNRHCPADRRIEMTGGAE